VAFFWGIYSNYGWVGIVWPFTAPYFLMKEAGFVGPAIGLVSALIGCSTPCHFVPLRLDTKVSALLVRYRSLLVI
jgi:hypothetical protein